MFICGNLYFSDHLVFAIFCLLTPSLTTFCLLTVQTSTCFAHEHSHGSDILQSSCTSTICIAIGKPKDKICSACWIVISGTSHLGGGFLSVSGGEEEAAAVKPSTGAVGVG